MKKHGLILINKPKGMTSHDVVDHVRRAVGQKEVGHAGTLDPLAEGLMVCLLGEATKLSTVFLEKEKHYIADILFGIETDSWDTDGQVTRETDPTTLKNLDLASFTRILKEVGTEGEIEKQFPVPIYSATKINGKKLYEYARAGQTIEIPMKPMRFFDLDVVEWNPPFARIFMKCSKGAFVRSFIHELGQRLEVGACMSGLTRTFSTPYSLERAALLSELQKGVEIPEKSFVSIDECLGHLKTVMVEGMSLRLLKNGQISHTLREQLVTISDVNIFESYKIRGQLSKDLVALVTRDPLKGFELKRVFQFN